MEQNIFSVIIEISKIILSTFVGGVIAIQFESRKRIKTEKEHIYSTLLKTQMALITQRNLLHNLEMSYIKEVRSAKNFYEVKSIVLDPLYVKSDIDELMNIINKDNTQLFFHIVICEHKLTSLLALLKSRNDAYQAFGEILYQMPFENAVQTTLAINLSTLTTPIVPFFDGAFKTNEGMIMQLMEYIKKQFPKKMALKISDEFEKV